MLCRVGYDQWLVTIMQHLTWLSKPQATVLTPGTFGSSPQRGEVGREVSRRCHQAMAGGLQGGSCYCRSWTHQNSRLSSLLHVPSKFSISGSKLLLISRFPHNAWLSPTSSGPIHRPSGL